MHTKDRDSARTDEKMTN